MMALQDYSINGITSKKPLNLTGLNFPTVDRILTTIDRCHSTPARPDSTADRPDSTADRPNSMTARPNSMTSRPNSTPDRPNSMTARPDSTADRLNSMTARPDSTTDRPNSTTDTYNSDSYSINSTIDTCNSDTYSTISTTNRIKKEAHAAATHICNFAHALTQAKKLQKSVAAPPQKDPPEKIFKTPARTRQTDTPTSDSVTFADQHHDTKDNRAATNNGFEEMRGDVGNQTLVLLITFVCADSLSLCNPALLKPVNRYIQLLKQFFEQLCSALYKINFLYYSV